MTPERAGKIGCFLAWVALAGAVVGILGIIFSLAGR